MISCLLGVVFTINALPDYRFCFAVISLIFLVGAFNTYNSIFDIKVDTINKPNRPLQKKQITIKEARIFSISLYSLALITGFFINQMFFIIVLVSAILTFLYSFKKIGLKKRFLVGILAVNFFYMTLCFLSGWSLYPNNPIPIYPLIFLFLFGFGPAILKDVEDLEGDKKYNIQSFPVIFGCTKTIKLASFFVIYSFILLLIFINENIFPQKYLLALLTLPLMMRTFYKIYNNLNKKELLKKEYHFVLLYLILTEIILISITI